MGWCKRLSAVQRIGHSSKALIYLRKVGRLRRGGTRRKIIQFLRQYGVAGYADRRGEKLVLALALADLAGLILAAVVEDTCKRMSKREVENGKVSPMRRTKLVIILLWIS